MEDPMTVEALHMMPTVTSIMTLMNTTIPLREENLDVYVAALLSRSYSAAWTALTSWLGEYVPPLQATYSAAMPSSQALVDLRRVYIWLGIQLLLTVSGALFLVLKARTQNPALDNTTLAAFYLDSSDVYQRGKYDLLKDGGLLTLRYEDGRLKVKVA